MPVSLTDDVEVSFVLDGDKQRVPLAEAWSVPFEHCSPARRFPTTGTTVETSVAMGLSTWPQG